MNCPDARNELAALLYGELDARQLSAIRQHAAECPKCRTEIEGLEHARKLLDAASPPPAVHVDAAAILRSEAERQLLRLRRWRRWTLAASAAAAALLVLAVGFKLELRVEAHQLVLRWGAPPVSEAAPVQAAAFPQVTADSDAAMQAQLVTLTRLAQGLIETTGDRDAKHRKELQQLRDGLRDLERQAGLRLRAIDRDVTALYAAVFGVNKKGASE